MRNRDRLAAPAAAVGFAAMAVGLGFACATATKAPVRGSALPKAGSPEDDGSGFVAVLSTKMSAVTTGGAQYGGFSYGGADDSDWDELDGEEPQVVSIGEIIDGSGGTRYGAYQFPYHLMKYRSPPQPFSPKFSAGAVTDAGILSVTVSWSKQPQVVEKLPAPGCGGSVVNHSIETVSGKHVAGAVVYLDGIKRGVDSVNPQSGFRMQAGGIAEIRDCQVVPRVQLVQPRGALLSIHSRVDSNFRITGMSVDHKTGKENDQVFERTLKGIGASARYDADVDGLFVMRAEKNASLRGWFWVLEHPYYGITDSRGNVRFPSVPKGTYDLVVWHPPVAKSAKNGTIEWTKSFVTKKRVSVKTGKTAKISLKL